MSLVFGLAVAGLIQAAAAQASAPIQDPSLGSAEPSSLAGQPSVESPESPNASAVRSSGLVIGPGDEVEVSVYGAPDLSGHTRVGPDGNISMALIGYVQIAGLSSGEAELAIANRLRRNNVVNDPQVSVYVKEYSSSGISVVGEVARPGFYPALGPHRLFDVLQTAGGLTDKAANQVMISHRNQKDATSVSISKNPADIGANNINLQAGDTVVVPKAGIVYVLGEVTRPGGYVLNATGGITVLQVVAVAGGPTHVASAGKTRLLRRTETGFQEQQIDLKKLLRGKTQDVAVKNEDILFIPSSGLKSALNTSALVATVGTAAIYHVPF
ncbi:MAG TPA: polysaccharide biosynthesis/export family protein [Candidatus Sulfotelmatobacter sp.]